MDEEHSSKFSLRKHQYKEVTVVYATPVRT